MGEAYKQANCKHTQEKSTSNWIGGGVTRKDYRQFFKFQRKLQCEMKYLNLMEDFAEW